MDTKATINRTLVIGDVRGLIENARYLEGELKKTIDVSITELIKPRSKKQSATMLKSAYAELKRKYDELVQRNGDLSERQRQAEDTIAKLKGTVTQPTDSNDEANKRLQDELNAEIERLSTEYSNSMQELSDVKEQLINSRIDNIDSKVNSTKPPMTTVDEAEEPVIVDQSNNFYYKYKSNESATDFIWTTSRNAKLAPDNKFGSLYIQNRRTDGVSIVGLELHITEDPNDDGKSEMKRNILDHGPLGFTNDRVPSRKKSVEIAPDKDITIPIFGGSDISGNSDKSIVPKGHSVYVSDKTYRGTVQLMVTYENGDMGKSNVIMWTINKKKDVVVTEKSDLVDKIIHGLPPREEPDKVIWPTKPKELNSTKPVEKSIPTVLKSKEQPVVKRTSITPEKSTSVEKTKPPIKKTEVVTKTKVSAPSRSTTKVTRVAKTSTEPTKSTKETLNKTTAPRENISNNTTTRTG